MPTRRHDAGVAHAVPVGVLLAGVGDLAAVVAGVADRSPSMSSWLAFATVGQLSHVGAPAVAVGVVRRIDRARVARVAQRVAVRVGLARVRDRRAVVHAGAPAVAVGVVFRLERAGVAGIARACLRRAFAWLAFATDGQLSTLPQTASPSGSFRTSSGQVSQTDVTPSPSGSAWSASGALGQPSHASPTPSASASACVGLATAAQTSSRSTAPSASESDEGSVAHADGTGRGPPAPAPSVPSPQMFRPAIAK